MDKTKQVNQKTGLLSQPKAVWAVAFACVISFMGIGLVDQFFRQLPHNYMLHLVKYHSCLQVICL